MFRKSLKNHHPSFLKMFGKLRDKLKSALNLFSKKAEEQAEVKRPSAEELIEKTKQKFEEKEGKFREGSKETETEPEETREEPGTIEKKPEEELKETGEEPETAEEGPAEDQEIPSMAEILDKADKELDKEEEPEKKSFFHRIREAITTKTISAEKFDNFFWAMEVALLENNVSVEVIEKIKDDLKKELVDKPLPRNVSGKIEETLKKTLGEILSFPRIDLIKKAGEKKPCIIAFFGINGSGKTTSIAKLTKYFQNRDKSVVLAACDTFRAAAIDQLQEHADRLQVKMIRHDYGSDAAAVAFDAVRYAEKNKIDLVLIDTAGRLHSNTNLMQELEKIVRVTKPDLKIFVGESITGNDCIEQARRFNELVEIDGSILTKADVDEKGGAPLSIAYTIKKPILFLGVGQSYGDLEEFDSKVVLGRLGF